MSKRRVLVVGARPGSIGAAVAELLGEAEHPVVTAGISGEEDLHLNVNGLDLPRMMDFFAGVKPEVVVCTMGLNMPEVDALSLANWYQASFSANVIGPMRLLEAWLTSEPSAVWRERHYVAISSNSAQVPRSGSAAYCASKAALSMALRCKAREMAVSAGPVVWGVEPGLVANTPMTAQTAERWQGQALTRMRPPELSEGISAGAVARMVAAGLEAGMAMNGVMLRLDADEA